jgi:hypothetical protein
MDQTKISEQISTLLKEGDEFLQSFQSVCSPKEANVFKIVEVPVQVFSSWGSQFGIFYLPYHTGGNPNSKKSNLLLDIKMYQVFV